MCGITGVWFLNNKPVEGASVINQMTDAISHRGPDGAGYWISDEKYLHLGHRRLAIIDLSEGGKQPMEYGNRYIITFNGEIYNYIELKQYLINKGYSFSSQSDTEVILASYSEWGTDCLNYFDGMFVFAIYDRVTNNLFCARDRFGEKPFYYSFFQGNFYFASEMKALWAAGVPRVPNKKLFYNYFAHDIVEDPLNQTNTFFTNIFKLKPSHFFNFSGGHSITQIQYWNLNIVEDDELDFFQASERLVHLLNRSLKRRLRSDVPIGTSLSGGLDSSTIVSLISEHMKSKHTFSARFKDFARDEGHYIYLVKDKFKTIHHDIYVTVDDFIQEMDKLIFHQEEPFQTGSIFAQYSVYKEARKQNIPVMLDGQGADELLGGYDKDFRFYLRELIQNDKSTDDFIKNISNNHSVNVIPGFKEGIRHRYPKLYRILSRVSRTYRARNPAGIAPEFYHQYGKTKSPFYEAENLKKMLTYELTNYGLSKLLKFADRNSMAHSVEVRLPFLDHELVEFVMSLKSSFFLHEGWSKALLRNGVKNILPGEIVYRKDKVGFEAPHIDWMKNKFLNEITQDYKNKLIGDKIISSDYIHNWKILIGSKVLYGL